MNDEWIEAVRDCIIAISADLNATDPLRRSRLSERALEELTIALVAAGKEAPDAT